MKFCGYRTDANVVYGSIGLYAPIIFIMKMNYFGSIGAVLLACAILIYLVPIGTNVKHDVCNLALQLICKLTCPVRIMGGHAAQIVYEQTSD